MGLTILMVIIVAIVFTFFIKTVLWAKRISINSNQSIYGVISIFLIRAIYLMFFIPVAYGLIYQFSGDGYVSSTVFYTFVKNLFLAGGVLYLKFIPIQIIITFIVDFLLLGKHNEIINAKEIKKIAEEKARQEAEERKIQREKEEEEIKLALQKEEELRRIKIINHKLIENANLSLIKINTEITELLSNVILESKKGFTTLSENNAVLSFKLPSTEHYDFYNNQSSEVSKLYKEILLTSNIPNESHLRKLLNGNQSFKTLYSSAINELDKVNALIENSKKYLNCKNSTEFHKPFYDICENKNLFSKNEYQKRFNDLAEQLKIELGIAKKGYLGESKVSEALELYHDVLINMENVRFEVEDTSVEADNIIICDNGVFCIETKNYGRDGETIEITKDGKWKRYRGREKLDISNVTEQHNRHIGIMQRTVNSELKNRNIDCPYIFFEPIYVIANDKVEIKNMSEELKVLRASSIYPYIFKSKPQNPLSKELQNEIKSIILEHKQDLLKYPVKDFRESFEYYFRCLISDIENKYMYINLYNIYINKVQELYNISIKEIDNEKYISLE